MRVAWLRRISACALALSAAPRAVWAHVGRAPEPHDLWTAWSVAPAVIIGLILAVWLYARGVRALWHSAGVGRGIPRWRVACFAGGIATLAIALLSPIDGVAAALFSVHMIQHMLLVVVAAPLLVLGDPALASLWALRIDARRGVGAWWRRRRVLPAIWHLLRRPLVAFTLHVAALWLWHLPTLYDAALRNEGVHVAEHVSFLATALLFWYPIADARPRQRSSAGVATLSLFAAGLQCTLLGALIAMSRHPWYFGHYATTAAWGFTPLEDQQLAGLIMWIPAGLVYLAALIPTVLPVLRGDVGIRGYGDSGIRRYGDTEIRGYETASGEFGAREADRCLLAAGRSPLSISPLDARGSPLVVQIKAPRGQSPPAAPSGSDPSITPSYP